jgi:protein-S-isoprenylcysteine O-methyltransferase Ste14
MTPISALVGLLAVFILTWIAAALWANRTVGVLPNRAQMPLYVGALLAALLLVIARLLFPVLRMRLWEENLSFDWAMVAVCAIGLAWCWWARLHLGKLWSAGVSRKEGHRVIDTGPYGIVRHPIYTGAILAMFAFAAARARPFDLLAALLVTVFFGCKARLEERFLQQEFGAAYDAYRQRVPMLVPFLRPRTSG